MKLTKREFTLLYLLGVVIVIWVSVTYLINPMNAANDTLAADIETLNEEKLEIEARLMRASGLKSSVENVKKELAAYDGFLYGEVPAPAADRLIYDIFTSSGLRVTSITVGGTETTDIGASGRKLSVEFNGTPTAFYALCDAAAADELYISVNFTSYSAESGDGTADLFIYFRG